MTDIKIKSNKGRPDVSSIKRLYIPGIVLEMKCPECGGSDKLDFADDYVSHYGEGDGIEERSLYCPECDLEVEFKYRLVISAKIELVK